MIPTKPDRKSSFPVLRAIAVFIAVAVIGSYYSQPETMGGTSTLVNSNVVDSNATTEGANHPRINQKALALFRKTFKKDTGRFEGPPLELRAGQTDKRRLNHYNSVYENHYDVVHVVSTKFMLHAGHLAHLAHTRLDLFETIALPSMLTQTNQEYLWIIYVDPYLDYAVLEELKYELNGVSNAVLISYPGRVTQDFRSFDIETITPEMVLKGSYDYLLSYHDAAQTRVTLDTRLDLDDGLNPFFVESIQNQAHRELSSSTGYEWRVWCVEQVLEWRFYNDQPKTQPEMTENGKMVNSAYTNYCVDTGLTVGYEVEAAIYDLPTVWQCVMHELIPRCNSATQTKCLERADMPLGFGVFRLRTPAGVGLKNMYPNYRYPTIPSLSQHDLWNIAVTDFAITQLLILALKSRFEAPGVMLPVLQEAERAHCLVGQPCKPSYVQAMQELQQQYV